MVAIELAKTPAMGSIAKAQLGNESRYKEIFEANRHLLSNPDSIDVGQTVRIPG
jgi:nucleoid-associated protein YgaU